MPPPSQRSPLYQQGRLEVLQDTAMRTMLRAPRWTSACVMQSETSLVPLTTKFQQIVAYCAARVMLHDGEDAAQSEASNGPGH